MAAEVLDTNGYFTLDVQQEDGQTLSVQFNHNNSEGTENWMSAEINGINIRTQIVSLTLVGHSSQLDVYVNEGLVGKVTARAIDLTEKANIVNSGGGNLSISSLDDPVQIYGVRYYDGRALTGTRQRTTDGFTPSEIEKNFKVDSKRYRIESTCNSTACNRCLRDADTEAGKKECRQRYLCPEIE